MSEILKENRTIHTGCTLQSYEIAMFHRTLMWTFGKRYNPDHLSAITKNANTDEFNKNFE